MSERVWFRPPPAARPGETDMTKRWTTHSNPFQSAPGGEAGGNAQGSGRGNEETAKFQSAPGGEAGGNTTMWLFFLSNLVSIRPRR